VFCKELVAVLFTRPAIQSVIYFLNDAVFATDVNEARVKSRLFM
jgi:hypothetical protein